MLGHLSDQDITCVLSGTPLVNSGCMMMIGILCAWVGISPMFVSVKCTWLCIVGGEVLRAGQFLRWMLLWVMVSGVNLVMWIFRTQTLGVQKLRAVLWKVVLAVSLVLVVRGVRWYLFEGAFSAKSHPPRL